MRDGATSKSADLTGVVHAVLDEFHAAAAAADEERYLACLAPDAVFLGTDPEERWAGQAFREFVHLHFSRGQGWAYTMQNRIVEIGADRKTAWFDERLESDWYGECRGTGVLQLSDARWKIEQYNLTIPIPNDLAAEFVTRVKQAR